MTDPLILFSLGSWPVTAYGLVLAAAVGIGLFQMSFATRRLGLPDDTAVRFGLWAVPLGLLGGRALYVALHWSLIVQELGWMQIFRLWQGGFALFGVVPGCMLAGVCCARRMRLRTADILNAAAPGAAFALALVRFAECFTPQGMGLPVDAPALQWLPLAIPDLYGEWMMPVFLWEGLAALLIAWLSARALRTPQRQSLDATSTLLLWLGATQVLLESLRTDDLLRLGLVKVSQVAAMALVVGVAVRQSVLARRAGTPAFRIRLMLVAVFIGLGCCIAVEFALDKSSIPNELLYLFMALALTGMVALSYRLGRLAAVPAPEAKG